VPLFLAVLMFSVVCPAQDSASNRKLLDHMAPPYPELARHLGITGVVKIDVVVGPDGRVKSADPRGGHPLLVQAATKAVRDWRWEPASRESRESVQVKFFPGE
jgi:TonB family protein